MAKDVVGPEPTVEQDEEEQLLPSSPEIGRSVDQEELEVRDEPIKDHSRTFIKVFAVVFFLNLGFQILAPAQIALFERIYCELWYDKHPIDPIPFVKDIPESLCKISPIQKQVSTRQGWYEFFSAAPGLLVSVPIGMITDVYGRRRMAIICLTTILLTQVWNAIVAWANGSIDLRFTWLGSILNFIGGGGVAAELLLVCICTDISTEAGLTNTFFRAAAFGFLSRVIGPLIAATLMRFNPWWAIYLGLSMLVVSVFLVTLCPETLPKQAERDPDDTAPPQSIRDQLSQLSWKDAMQSVKEALVIWKDWRLLFVALTYPFRLVCNALSDLIQRYVSDRYGWTLANATLMYSIQAVGASVVLFTLLPWVSNQIDKRSSWSAIRKNVMLSRASLLTLVFAYAVIGIAPTAPIFVIGLLIETLATGLPATMRALASAVVESADTGRVFSVLAVVETLSTMMAYPISASFFNVGLEKGGGMWLGLPYDTIAVGAAVAFLAMCLVRFERPIALYNNIMHDFGQPISGS